MKKTLLLFGIGLLSYGYLHAQDDEGFEEDKAIEKLRSKYADEKYESCADAAIKYTDSKKHQDKPEVYIYASMACLRISQTNEGREDYKKAFSDALSYAGKYRRKDPNGEFYNEYITHFEEMKKIIAEEVENYMLEDRKTKVYKSAKKSLSLINKIHKMDPNDKGVHLTNAVLELKVKNTMEGKKMMKILIPEIKYLVATSEDEKTRPVLTERELEKKNKKIDQVLGDPLKEIKPFDEMTEMEQVFLKLGLIEYAEYLFDKKKYDEAKEVIEIGKPFFYEKNELYEREYRRDYKDTYNMING
jgi:hypothetical protein|tara:strand:- start:128 stop:1033 length:906 start_codon:yes stop_codon:yes gene_type:complete